MSESVRQKAEAALAEIEETSRILLPEPKPATEVVAPGWSIARVPLDSTSNSLGGSGAHTLTADQPVGLQVMGFGHATSYYYPGGLNLEFISEPPPVIIK